MRISTNTIFQRGISKISELQGEQSRLQQQISTGKRILSPSDDPVAAAHSLEIKQSLARNSQYTVNRVLAQNQLSIMDSTLGRVSELVLSAQSNTTAAGNATYSDSERGYLAAEVRGALDELISLANTKDGTGHYLFAGFKNTAPAFVKTAGGADYQGDSNQQNLQVSSSRQMAISETGDRVFQGNNADLFKTLNDLAALLETPVSSAADRTALQAGLAKAGEGMNLALDNILNARATVGSKLKELDAIDVSGQDTDLQLTKTLSGLEDLDYAQAISDLNKQQIILSAAQQSFVKTTSLSLFNFI